MAMTTFRHGNPIMVDYTPSSGNVALGDVVLLGTVTANTKGTGAVAMVALRPITNNTLGALSVAGGVYGMVNLDNAAGGAKVWWDASTNKATTTSTNNAAFGFIVANGGGGANTTCYVYHNPFPPLPA